MGSGAKLWWRYAFRAVCIRLRQGRPSWREMVSYLKIQRQYIPLYVQQLQEGKQGGSGRILELDASLPTNVILHFRKLAHAKHQRATQTAGAVLRAVSRTDHLHTWCTGRVPSCERCQICC